MADVPLRRPRMVTVRVVRAVLVVVLLVILAAIGLRAGVLVGRPAGEGSVRAGYVKVPVANRRIAALERLELGHLIYAIVKKEQVSPEWLLDPQKIAGRAAAVAIAEKSPFKESMLGPLSGETGAVGAIRKGWVAVTLDLDKVQAPLGLLGPGTAVVLLASADADERGSNVTVVSRKAFVLSVSAPRSDMERAGLAPRAGGGPASASQWGFALQIPAEDALKFVQAQKAGRLHLVVLGSAQGDEADLISVPELKPQESVEVIRGSRRSVEFSRQERGARARQSEKEE